MAKSSVKYLNPEQEIQLLQILKTRFEKNRARHKNLDWSKIEERLKENPGKIWSLNEMENTGGEPDVFEFDNKTNEYVFYDFTEESPKGRRSICYDQEALNARKKHKPKNSALNMAAEMGVTVLDETQYRKLQQLGNFDNKTSSWLKTPEEIRNLGGAIFGDYRYGSVFIYHNGVQSYYASRGFRAYLKV